MDSYRRQQIEAKAKVLLIDCGVTSIPVDPIAIAKSLEIQVHAKSPGSSGASGWLIRHGDDYAIVYATNVDSVGFQHFSVAHELGHYCLEGHPEHVFRLGHEHESRGGFSSADHIEREADYFAACLLMPRHLCAGLVSRSKDGMAAVLSLAKTCETSLTAAALRYAEIGHKPAGVVQCLNGKVEFCAVYSLRAHVGWATPLSRNSKVPSGSATARLAADPEAIRACLEDSENSEASDWFSGAKGGVYLDEEAMGLGRFARTLTLLTTEPADMDEEDDSEEEDKPRFR